MFVFNKDLLIVASKRHNSDPSQEGAHTHAHAHTQCQGFESITLLLQWWSHLVFWYKILYARGKTAFSTSATKRKQRTSLVLNVIFTMADLLQQSYKTTGLSMIWPIYLRFKKKNLDAPSEEKYSLCPLASIERIALLLNVPEDK